MAYLVLLIAAVIFPSKSRAATCKVVSELKLDPYVREAFSELDTLVRTAQGNSDSMRKLILKFHDRLDMPLEKLQNNYLSQRQNLGSQLEYSLRNIWKISGEGSKQINCPNDIEMLVRPLYGYSEQYVIEWQVLGKDLGRIFVFFVQVPNKEWKIGFFRFKKWTHLGKNHAQWFEAAGEEKLSQFFMAQIAQKLVGEHTHIEYPLFKAYSDVLEVLFTRDSLVERLNQVFSVSDIVAADAIFIPEALALKVRFLLPAELSSKDLRQHCEGMLTKLSNLAYLSDFTAMNCSYTLVAEDPAKEGRMGGLLVKK
jgi:hypothetical protein